MFDLLIDWAFAFQNSWVCWEPVPSSLHCRSDDSRFITLRGHMKDKAERSTHKTNVYVAGGDIPGPNIPVSKKETNWELEPLCSSGHVLAIICLCLAPSYRTVNCLTALTSVWLAPLLVWTDVCPSLRPQRIKIMVNFIWYMNPHPILFWL